METISLGHNCIVAITLIEKKLLKQEHVFDGMYSGNLRKFVDLLETQAADIFHNIEGGPLQNHHNSCWTIRDAKYHIISLHDVPITIPQKEACKYLLQIKQPMINRLFNTLEKAKCPHIIRSNLNQSSLEDVIRLYDAIKKIRDERAFHLHVLQDAPFAERNWRIPGLHLYRVVPPSWRENQMAWEITPSWNLAFQSILRSLTTLL